MFRLSADGPSLSPAATASSHATSDAFAYKHRVILDLSTLCGDRFRSRVVYCGICVAAGSAQEHPTTSCPHRYDQAEDQHPWQKRKPKFTRDICYFCFLPQAHDSPSLHAKSSKLSPADCNYLEHSKESLYFFNTHHKCRSRYEQFRADPSTPTCHVPFGNLDAWLTWLGQRERETYRTYIVYRWILEHFE
jgi:hypothetical protein